MLKTETMLTKSILLIALFSAVSCQIYPVPQGWTLLDVNSELAQKVIKFLDRYQKFDAVDRIIAKNVSRITELFFYHNQCKFL